MIKCINEIPYGITFDDFKIIPNDYTEVDSRLDVNLETRFSRNIPIQFPLVPAPMMGVVNIQVLLACSKLGLIGAIPRFYPIEEIRKMINGLSKDKARYGISVSFSTFENVKSLLDEVKTNEELIMPLFLNLDIAHGGMKKAYDFVEKTLLPYCRENKMDCVVGNVATAAQAAPYFRMGVDGIRAGIGNGSSCTTSIMTGCGYPLLNSLDEIFDERQRLADTENPEIQNITIISDGGVRVGGEIVKALCVGADCIMSGKIFAFFAESDWMVDNIPKQYGEGVMYHKEYRGSSTFTNNRSWEGTVQHIKLPPNIRPMSMEDGITEIAGQIVSGFSYIGAKTIEEVREMYMFILISNHAFREGLPRE